MCKSVDHVSNLWTINKYTAEIQLPLNFTAIFELCIESIFGLRQLLGVVGTLMLAFDNTLDYHAMIELVSPVVIVEILRIN